ncbi:MAG: NAD(P)H-hydrate dehydratase [Spirochaetales bacterium]|nr:NAD(P)H-hydrate dehydratase [Spirochaetales bacterium]
MQYLYSSQQSLEMDRRSQDDCHIPGLTLMENASASAYSLIRDDLLSACSIVFVAGGGNNGGDALTMARLAWLDGIRNIRILSASYGRCTDLRDIQMNAVKELGIPVFDEIDPALEGADLIIDGLFGVGLKGEPREPYDGLIARINLKKCKVISLDVPSGMGDSVPYDKSIKADKTICMGVLKSALYLPWNRDFSGEILITDPIFPASVVPESDIRLLDDKDLLPIHFKGSDYKRSRGHIAIIGGSRRFTGAVTLAARAAFHSGAGLVTVFTDERLIPIISKAVPSAMVGSYDDVKNTDLSSFDCVLCGPGMGKNHDDMVSLCIDQARKVVIDADGIRAFSRLHADGKGKCILTPHPGEYAALLSSFLPEADISIPSSFISTLETLSEITGCQIIYKANTVWVRSPNRISVIDGQNPSLGTAGSGDVLSGITASLFAAGREDAAANAALIHQKAGALARDAYGFYSSDELIRFIGKAATR